MTSSQLIGILERTWQVGLDSLDHEPKAIILPERGANFSYAFPDPDSPERTRSLWNRVGRVRQMQNPTSTARYGMIPLHSLQFTM